MTGSPKGGSAFRPLSRWERAGLYLLLALLVAHSLLVGFRSLALTRRMTDLDAFLRGAWAARVGADVYRVSDENHWHYIYPPPLAILLTPFADPPAGAELSYRVPFGVSVFMMYAFSVLCAFAASHWLAGALERRSRDPAVRSRPTGCWRWWALRAAPLLVAAPGGVATLARGQVNLLLLALLCGMIAAVLHRRSWLAGLLLSGAICLKVIPAFLLLYALWRRDVRCLAGCALGLALGLVAIPCAFWGPQRAAAQYQDFAAIVLCPGLGLGRDHMVAKTLTDVTGTDSQSLMAVLHNTMFLSVAARPDEAAAPTRAAALLAGGLLTALTLWSAGWNRRRTDEGEVLFLGQLILVMLFLSPVCHLAYFCLALPVIMVVTNEAWIPAVAGGKARLLTAWFIMETVAATLPHLPTLGILRDVGLAMYAALGWWVAAWIMLLRRTRTAPSAEEAPAAAPMAA